jgi:GNAT superfamily N-acetyltransferase
MQLIYRETQISDVEELFVVRANTRENRLSKENLASLGITTESVAASISAGQIKGYVCLDDSTLVAFCNGDLETGEILVLAVRQTYEGKGIGTRVLARVVELLRSAGHLTIWLAASPSDAMRAHGFYRSLGWRPNGAKQDNGDEILVLHAEARSEP